MSRVVKVVASKGKATHRWQHKIWNEDRVRKWVEKSREKGTLIPCMI